MDHNPSKEAANSSGG